jgi:hypothetical protein
VFTLNLESHRRLADIAKKNSWRLSFNVTRDEVNNLRFFECLCFASQRFAFEDESKGMTIGHIEEG